MSQTDRYSPSLYLTIAANFFFFTSFQWSFVALPGYIQELGGDAALIGLAYGLFTLSAVVARPGVGWLADHWGRKPVLLVGAAIFALSPVLYALTSSVWPFMIVRLLHGLGISAFTTAYTALVADLAPPARLGEAVGLSGVTTNLGLLFAPALGAYLQVQWGYSAHFLVAAIIAAASFVTLLPVREPQRDTLPETRGSSFRTVGKVRTVWVAALGSTGLAVAYGAVLSFLAPFTVERQLIAAGLYFTAYAVAMIIAQALAGWLSDRIGRRAVAAPGMAIAALSMFALAGAHTDAIVLAAGAGLGLGWGLTRAGLDTAVVDAVTPEMRGSAVSFLYTWVDIGVGVGSFGLGIVAQRQSYAASFYLAAIWAALALAGYLVWGRRKKEAVR
jgi:MFS family permease